MINDIKYFLLTFRDFFFPREDDEGESKLPENEVKTETPENEDTKINDETAQGKVYLALLAVIVILGVCVFPVLALDGKADQEVYSTSWSVVEGSSKKATVVKSQFGVRPYHQDAPRTCYAEWFSCIVVETEDGETGTFICKQEDPIAGLSVGDNCTICIKQRSSLTNSDTAYFINDMMVYYCTEEDLSKAFLKDFD